MKKLIAFFIALLLPISPMAYAVPCASANQIGIWLLDEASGTRSDSGDAGNDLTDNNTVGQSTGSECGFSPCADFESTNSESLSVTDASCSGCDFTTSENYTLTAWVKTESQPGTYDILNKHDGADGYVFRFGQNTANKLSAIHGSVGNVDADTAISNDTLTHFGIIYNGTTVQHYQDNATDGSGTLGTMDNGNNEADMYIGGTDYMDGELDDILWCNEDISASELTDIYNNGLSATFFPRSFLNVVVMLTLTFASIHTIYYGKVYQYRSRINTWAGHQKLKIPEWMRVFEVREAWADAITDRTAAVMEFGRRALQQRKQENGRYVQERAEVMDGVTYETHEYLGPQGAGYVQYATRTEGERTYRLCKQHGPEKRDCNENDWEEIVRV